MRKALVSWAPDDEWADLTGFEPATSGLTGRRALQAAPQVPVAGDRTAGRGAEPLLADWPPAKVVARLRDPRR